MSSTDAGEDLGTRAARARALALLRVRGTASAVAVAPAAVAVVLAAAVAQGHLRGSGWTLACWIAAGVSLVVLLVSAGVARAVARARPAVSPTVPVTEGSAPDLYRLVRDLAVRLDVPAPSAIELTPDCDSWLEDRTHTALAAERTGAGSGPPAPAHRRGGENAPVLVIGSPFLWWMRVAELRAVLAPVVAGTAPAAHPDIAAARRFVRGLDGAVADASAPGAGRLRGAGRVFVGRIARLLLRGCRGHAAEMERCVALASSMRAQGVDYGLRIAAQEQIGLVYAGWDRLLTRVALPAWRMGRWPARLDAGVVSALTELSRRDRLAEGFASRLDERPACDLLDEPGAADEAASLLAARLFHGGPAGTGPDWSPVDWQEYPQEVVDRKWRTEAARLHRVMDSMGVRPAADADAGTPTLARVIEHLSGPDGGGEDLAACIGAAVAREEAEPLRARAQPARVSAAPADSGSGSTDARSAAGALPSGPAPTSPAPTPSASAPPDRGGPSAGSRPALPGTAPPSAPPAGRGQRAAADPLDLWGPGELPLFPLQPPRTGTELLVDHVAAMVCCAAVDTAGARPGLDWLDGPALLVDGTRKSDLGAPVLSLVEDGDAEPLRSWLAELGIRSDRPVRLG
ncbi:hypothetical protein [uncultured Streptomyces sp.]|uniref:hypothetical protein n=1 Tax=uncultured Streptomyces sp. TaxID=174707 RepID=UPI00260A7238|nr:hypothetical protein [uncultured Streptomyces sp.]